MNLEKVIFAFFIVLALTLNFGFYVGQIDNPVHHNVYELYAALVVSLVATILKLGDRTQTESGSGLAITYPYRCTWVKLSATHYHNSTGLLLLILARSTYPPFRSVTHPLCRHRNTPTKAP